MEPAPLTPDQRKDWADQLKDAEKETWNMAASFIEETYIPLPMSMFYEVIIPLVPFGSLLVTNHTLPVRHTIRVIRETWTRQLDALVRRFRPKCAFVKVQLNFHRGWQARLPKRQLLTLPGHPTRGNVRVVKR